MKGKNDHLKLVKNKNENRSGLKRAFRLFGKLVIVVVVVLLLKEGEQFFRINSIDMEGSREISVTELAAAGDINKGKSIFLLDEDKIAEKITNEFPSIRSVRIERTLPDQLLIKIDQREPAAYMVTADGYWLVDFNVVPYKNIAEPDQEFPEITGISGELVVPGVPLTCSFRREILQEFFSTWQGKGHLEIVKLDMSKSYNLIAYTADNLEIWFGNAKEMDQKMELIESSLPYISAEPGGTRLDVRSGKRLVLSSAAVINEREVDP
ncbi:MAG: cell division protein FtsQ/DivIB [Bacillota bacterium]